MCQPSCQALGAQPTWFCPYEALRLSGETRRHARHMPLHPRLMAQGKEAMGQAHLEWPEKASARKSPPGEIRGGGVGTVWWEAWTEGNHAGQDPEWGQSMAFWGR